MPNSYRCSDGTRVKKTTIDYRVRKAKKQKLDQFFEEHNCYFCEECETNQGFIDCSHDLSVKECQESGRSELAWSVDNITLRCRECHQLKDSTDLRFSSST